MIRKVSIYFLLMWAAFWLSACGGEEPEPKGRFAVVANHYVDFAPLVLNSTFAYENEAGNLFKVSSLRYYISEVRLHRPDGSFYEVPVAADGSTGIYLIDESKSASKALLFEEVPAGDYSAMSWTVGVDAGMVDWAVESGPLAPSEGMRFDTQADGFVACEVMGVAYVGNTPSQPIAFAFGGWQAPLRHLHRAHIEFGGLFAIVSADRTPEVEYIADIGALFQGPPPVDFLETPSIEEPSGSGVPLASFATAFTFDHLHN